MKHRFVILCALLAASYGYSSEETPIVPKGWIDPQHLAAVQGTLQKQLDTGIAMLDTAWNMAKVRDAELLVVYLALYEKLAPAGREVLFKEQEKWLKQREKAASAADDGKSGTIGRLQVAQEHEAWSVRRIAELKKRLPKK